MIKETEILIYKGNMYASEKAMSKSTLGERALKRLTFQVEGSERPWNAPRNVRITYLCAWDPILHGHLRYFSVGEPSVGKTTAEELFGAKHVHTYAFD